jgi:hypothetical protein
MRINVAKSTWELHTHSRTETSAITRILAALLQIGALLDERDLPVEIVLPARLYTFTNDEYVHLVNGRLRGAKIPIRLSEVYVAGDASVLVVAPSVGLGSLCEE